MKSGNICLFHGFGGSGRSFSLQHDGFDHGIGLHMGSTARP